MSTHTLLPPPPDDDDNGWIDPQRPPAAPGGGLSPDGWMKPSTVATDVLERLWARPGVPHPHDRF